MRNTSALSMMHTSMLDKKSASTSSSLPPAPSPEKDGDESVEPSRENLGISSDNQMVVGTRDDFSSSLISRASIRRVTDWRNVFGNSENREQCEYAQNKNFSPNRLVKECVLEGLIG